jgi:fumarylacetoacetase
MNLLNETHDPKLNSWVASANSIGADFPIQNLPFAVFRKSGSVESFRGGVAIGDQVLDLAQLHASGLLNGDAQTALAQAAQSSLNGLMAIGPRYWSALRLALSRLLREPADADASAGAGASASASASAGVSVGADAVRPMLLAQSEVEFAVPAQVGDYTDFYASVYHATNIGKLFRPDAPLTPNYKWMPIAYHGRASSIGVSGQSFPRPRGQIMPAGASAPIFSACQRLDFELELGVWIGPGNQQGQPIALNRAEEHLFGMCLLNDWSARDIQAWEYVPLGPFLAKNFATTISPWIITLEALAPYRVAWLRPADDPQPLPYLDDAENRQRGGIDITIESWLESEAMRQAKRGASRLSHSSFKHSYWNIGQMLAHHTIGGCNMNPGDLLGTGTQSGPTAAEAAALIELTQGGKNPITLNNGETRSFLHDGDAIILRAWCEKSGCARIGFGESRGLVLPAG